MSAALSGFEGKGLTVEQRNGRIYVSMDNKLLFPSGSAAVDTKGREAIGKLSKAIENEKELSILVEGHTDTDKIGAGSSYKDNWDLSVARATSVVRIMQESSKVDPVRITAAGRGESNGRSERQGEEPSDRGGANPRPEGALQLGEGVRVRKRKERVARWPTRSWHPLRLRIRPSGRGAGGSGDRCSLSAC